VVLLAISTGLRQSELFGLKWGDIDFFLSRTLQQHDRLYEFVECHEVCVLSPVDVQQCRLPRSGLVLENYTFLTQCGGGGRTNVYACPKGQILMGFSNNAN
jgi:hypothetical protein